MRINENYDFNILRVDSISGKNRYCILQEYKGVDVNGNRRYKLTFFAEQHLLFMQFAVDTVSQYRTSPEEKVKALNEAIIKYNKEMVIEEYHLEEVTEPEEANQIPLF